VKTAGGKQAGVAEHQALSEQPAAEQTEHGHHRQPREHQLATEPPTEPLRIVDQIGSQRAQRTDAGPATGPAGAAPANGTAA
jgi:hypothetical protein